MGGMTRLLLLLLAGVTVSTVVDLHKRIINGKKCEDSERQYHVKLVGIDPDGGTDFCGGSLITSQWIVTAAHCWKPKRTLYAVVGVHPGPGQKVEIITDPVIYKQNGVSHDIMLLKLPYPTNIQNVSMCDLPLEEKDEVQLAGHGATTTCSDGQRRPRDAGALHCTKMDVVECRFTKTLGGFEYPHLICSQRTGTDACLGDSGGGVVYQERLYGVIVRTSDPVKGYVGVTGSIDLCNKNYIDWISRETKN